MHEAQSTFTARAPLGLLRVAVEIVPLVAAAIAVLYAIGFVVVNAYLGQYGVRDVEPLRSRYIAAALPFLAALLGTWLGASFARSRLPNRPGTLAQPWGFLFWLIFYVLVAVFAALFITLVTFSAYTPNVRDLTAVADQYGRTFRFTSTVALLFWITQGAGPWPGLTRGRPLGATRLFAVLIFTLGAVTSFGPIYAFIPTWIGGGQPSPVLVTLAVPIEECPECSEEAVWVIDEDSLRLVILVARDEGANAVEIARSNVLSVRHLTTPMFVTR